MEERSIKRSGFTSVYWKLKDWNRNIRESLELVSKENISLDAQPYEYELAKQK